MTRAALQDLEARAERDLLALDPVASRRLLFDSDPVAYWQRFPLRPPRVMLSQVLKFPPSDLPGQRE